LGSQISLQNYKLFVYKITFATGKRLKKTSLRKLYGPVHSLKGQAMRKYLQSTYLFIMGLQGFYALVLIVVFGLGLPNAIEQQMPVISSVTIGIISLFVAVMIIVPSLTPQWLGRPNKKRHMLPVLIVTGLFPLLFGILGMNAVIMTGIEEPLSQTLIVGAALPTIFLSGMLWWVGLVLCVWPLETPAEASDQTTPAITPAQPAPEATVGTPIDLHELRLSRMGANVN
jgi:hypothetical protein